MGSGYREKLGRIAVLSLNMGLAMAGADRWYGDESSSLLFPGVVCFIITYVICRQTCTCTR